MALELLPFRTPAPRFALWCDDASLKIDTQPADRFRLSGKVEHDFPVGTTLHFRSGKEETQVPLALGTRAPDVVRALRRALPRGVFIGGKSAAEATELTFTQTVIPAARLPVVRVLTSDLSQRLRLLDTNQVEVIGATKSRCFVTLLVDSRRTTLTLDEGTSALDTAKALGSRCPFGFRAEVEGSIVTFWKCGDSTEIAA
jgi:hypothetical protein